MKRQDIVSTLIPTMLITAIGYLAGAYVSRLALHPGHDALQYIGMLHHITHGSWEAISFIWPPGFPLLALPLTWIGWQPDMALFTIQLFSFATIVVLLWFLMAETNGWLALRTLLLLSFALAPILHIVMYDFRSELPFAALMVILAWVPWPWKNSSRAITAGLLITTLFLVRYVGISFAVFPALAWFAIRPGRAGTGRMTVLAMLSASLLMVLYIVAMAEAPVTGYAMTDYNANMDVLTHASNFGLSFLGMIGVHAHLYLEGSLRIVAGILLLIGVAAILIAGIQSRHPRVALLSLAAALYAVSIILMRCLFWFDALSGARFALPVLPALIAVLGSTPSKYRLAVNSFIAGTAVLVVVQIIQLFL